MSTPPNDIAAERSVLSCILINPASLIEAQDFIKDSSDFWNDTHRQIYEVICALDDEQRPIDIVTICSMAKQLGLKGVDASYLAELLDVEASSANIWAYAETVSSTSQIRRVYQACRGVIERADKGGCDPSAFVEDAERAVLEAASARSGSSTLPVSQVVDGEADKICAAKDRTDGTPTGWDDLDTLLAGLHKGDLVILAGRPSMGKSAVAINLMSQWGQAGYSSLMVSLEMSIPSVVRRMICRYGRVPGDRIRLGRLDADMRARVKGARDMIRPWPIWIDDTPALTVQGIRSRARRIAHGSGLDLLIVDYMQLMHGKRSGSMSREEVVSGFSRALKALAKELDIPVVALSQLNRSLEGRPDKRPKLFDLRESGALEQDADVVMFVYRDEVYNANSLDAGIVELIIGKQRNGPLGSVRLRFDLSMQCISNIWQISGAAGQRSMYR